MTTPSNHPVVRWRSSALVLLVVLAPPLAQGLLARDGSPLRIAASLDGVAVAPAAVLAAVCLYTSWRISAAVSPSWVVAGLVLVGIQSISFAALQLDDADRTARQHGWMALTDVLMVATLLAFRAMNGRGPLRLSPTASGAAAGAVIGLLRVAAVSRLPQFDPTAWQRALIAAAGVSMALALSWLVVRGGVLPFEVRTRFAAAILLLAAGHTVTSLDGTDHHWVNVAVALACSALAAVAFVTAGTIMLRRGFSDYAERANTHLEELEQVLADYRHHRARLHELGSTIAGIRSAGELLRDSDRIGPERRRELEEMIHAEVCRLERLLSEERAGSTPPAPEQQPRPTGPEPSPSVDLDAALATLAVLHEAKGTSVNWERSGLRVSAPGDDVTEVFNILLDNAARHGDGAPTVSVHDADAAGGTVEILVSDNGPGIAPEVRDQLFSWGAKANASPGQGIGLNIAHTLVSQHGGYLRVQDVPGVTSGATFVVGLPIVRESAEAADGVLA